MKVVSVQEMKDIDRRAIEEYGIPSLVLMENAGLNVVMAMEEEFKILHARKIWVFAGKGKNGGDGLVAARHLANMGSQVKVYLLAKAKDVKGDTKTQLEIVKKMGIKVLELTTAEDFEAEKAEIETGEIYIDAILGIGQVGPVVDFLAGVIVFLNYLNKPIVAVDLPSGLQADTGRVEGACISAMLTVTFALPKIGLVNYPGANYVGKLIVADIGIPWGLLQSVKIMIELITKYQIIPLIPFRDSSYHKGAFGKVLVIAGSMGMGGAAELASKAVLRSGAGLAVLACPKSLVPCFESKLTEVIKRPLAETKDQSLDSKALGQALKLSETVDAVALGPGLSRHPKTSEFVVKFLGRVGKPVVIDADGLNALEGRPEVIRKMRVPVVVTPHPGEMARLKGLTIKEVQNNRIAVAGQFSAKNKCVVVLKGAATVVAHPEGPIGINSTGNSGMATAGSGDVLTGMIAAFLAQGLSAWDASRLGVYWHGLAGDLAAKAKGEPSMVASDILENLASSFLSLTQGG